jgi:hypothetical protein
MEKAGDLDQLATCNESVSLREAKIVRFTVCALFLSLLATSSFTYDGAEDPEKAAPSIEKLGQSFDRSRGRTAGTELQVVNGCAPIPVGLRISCP